MKTRDVIKFLGGVAAGWPLLPACAEAQEPGRTYRLGGLFSNPRDAPQYKAMFEEFPPLLFGNHQLIIERTTALRLPAMYQWPETAEEGGFVGYGPRLVHLYRDVMARQLIKILRGTKPADIPVEQPTKFDLVINLKAAKAIGLTIPESFLARADGVIE
jgi:ABC transporter substrate binding protein